MCRFNKRSQAVKTGTIRRHDTDSATNLPQTEEDSDIDWSTERGEGRQRRVEGNRR